MPKARIVKRTSPGGRVEYVIQQKHFLFRWWWVDAHYNFLGEFILDYFSTLEEAQKNFCYFDGTPMKDEVVQGG